MSNNFDTGNHESSSIFPILKVVLPIVAIVIIVKIFSGDPGNGGDGGDGGDGGGTGGTDGPTVMTAEQIKEFNLPSIYLITVGIKAELQLDAEITVKGETVRQKIVLDNQPINVGGTGTGFAVTRHDIITNRHVTACVTKDMLFNPDKFIEIKKVAKQAILKKFPNVEINEISWKLLSFERCVSIYNPPLWGDKKLDIPDKDIKEASNRDLSWIHVEEEIPKLVYPVVINTNSPKLGETVYALGYPGYTLDLAMIENIVNGRKDKSNIQLTMDTGNIKKDRTIFSPMHGNCYEHSASLNHGNSGGPLFNQYGDVIGVNTWGFTDTVDEKGVVQVKAAGTSYSISVDDVRTSFKKLWEDIVKDYSPKIYRENLE